MVSGVCRGTLDVNKKTYQNPSVPKINDVMRWHSSGPLVETRTQHTKRKYGKPYRRIQQPSQVHSWSNLVLHWNQPANLFEVANCPNYLVGSPCAAPSRTPHAVVWMTRLELVSSPWAQRLNGVELNMRGRGGFCQTTCGLVASNCLTSKPPVPKRLWLHNAKITANVEWCDQSAFIAFTASNSMSVRWHLNVIYIIPIGQSCMHAMGISKEFNTLNQTQPCETGSAHVWQVSVGASKVDSV